MINHTSYSNHESYIKLKMYINKHTQFYFHLFTQKYVSDETKEMCIGGKKRIYCLLGASADIWKRDYL